MAWSLFLSKLNFWHGSCCWKSLCKSLILNELRRARPFTQVLDYQRVTKGTPDSMNCSERADGDRQGESYLLIYIYVFIICKQSCKKPLHYRTTCSMFSSVGRKTETTTTVKDTQTIYEHNTKTHPPKQHPTQLDGIVLWWPQRNARAGV